ncbi:NACHT domain-containing protein [Streptomyces sp. NPDC090022]|uniref:NACHT domain-containing protein n=1 Tax=Streptomyces sp. NPDC090022 TaxID=3365920 RepID=UPI0037FBCAE8
MAGIETAVLRTATAMVGRLVTARLGQVPGAGLTERPVRPAARWRRPAGLGEAELRRLAEGLADRLGGAAAGLPEHERLAALDAAADAFAALGPVDADALLAADLDPAALAARLPVPPGAGLSTAAEPVCRELIRLTCVHAVEYLTTLPGFGARADVELVRRTGRLQRSVDRLAERADRADRPGGAAWAFEERYARYIAKTHGRLQLFGLTTGRRREEWALDLAYIGLAVSGEQQHPLPGEAVPHRTTVRAEQALAAADRVLLRGPAGSGKSTLLQWLAVDAARRAGGPWGTYVPFVLRLRAFTTAQALPLPEEFLKAAGVPLAAPPGWAEDLMHSGRALVLVDGVDEVPQRLRARTETWLRSLVSAFPMARYVVTTRPSAVPEDWLAGQRFTPHALVPMEREDVRDFLAHWHRAARAEAGPSGTDGEDLAAYEASLLEAVSARRDLVRLATNPLMCALLCALNRDRRMQLPRARKELYDAALDMLLVRRDTEREIHGVEGVRLTRDEQILLLQRFAYWLIRNGQVQADRDEAVEMTGEWLAAMPQVREQGDAEQVFAHLLIRSGLLREPVPGTVDFVHRTFQDYLGAKAAVESRDFGVLVRNAHDDTWDDVVRMAVGHARPDERTRLLRGLLRRADRTKGIRNRLVLLAAAGLEHAPELDPAVRADVQARTADLLPPRTPEQAEELAKAGGLVLDLLPASADGLGEAETAATVRTAALVGGDQALAVIRRFREDVRPEVIRELDDAWGRFKADEYAEAVLDGASLGSGVLTLRTQHQLDCLAALPQFKRLRLDDVRRVPPEVAAHRGMEALYVIDSPELTDLGPLSGCRELEHISLTDCTALTDLGPLAEVPLRYLFTFGSHHVDLGVLERLPGLDSLGLATTGGHRSVGELPGRYQLTSAWLHEGTEDMSLDGLERWPDLSFLGITGSRQAQELRSMARPPDLTSLQLLHDDAYDLEDVLRFPRLDGLYFADCRFTGGLGVLRQATGLKTLSLSACGTVDLAPLAGLADLTVHLYGGTDVTGAEGFPPERLRVH